MEIVDLVGHIPIPLPISSSAIDSATYTPDDEELEITFTDGSTYVYTVDVATVAAFISESSQGQFFNSYIRPRGGTPA